jgi:hypothetical protein
MLKTVISSIDFEKLKRQLKDSVITQGYRRKNIRQFIATRELSQVALSKALGYTNSTYLGQMIGTSPIRPITEKTARKIEECYGLKHLSLDEPTEFTISDLEKKDVPSLYEKSIDAMDGNNSLTALASMRRKYERVDYDAYRSNDTPLSQSSANIVESNQKYVSLDLIRELISFIESKEVDLPTSKLCKIMQISFEEIAKTEQIDDKFISTLIDLGK